MFQYAYAKALELRGYNVKIDTSSFKNYHLHGGYQLYLYNIDLDVSTKKDNDKYETTNIFFKLLLRVGINLTKRSIEKNLNFNETFFNPRNKSYIEGYFQNERYFKSIRDIILKQFTLSSELSKYTKSILKQIKTKKSTCSIHVRRGDFITKNNKNIHSICSIEYYIKAIDHIKSINDKTFFFVFSDDILWCEKNLNFERMIFINSSEKRVPHEDIYLMSLCNYNVISNSTFGWWGAWLNQNKNQKVVAPKRWFSDKTLEQQSKYIVCDSWIKI